MKWMAIIFIAVGIVSEGLAQETKIISFTPPGTLSWTNSQTNVFYVVEYKWDWGYDWTAVSIRRRRASACGSPSWRTASPVAYPYPKLRVLAENLDASALIYPIGSIDRKIN